MSLAEKVGTGEVVSLDPSSLKPGPSVRREKVSIDHVNRLRPVLDACPPIVVAHPQMVIVDGHHRTSAARLSHVAVRAVLVALAPGEIFEQAVKANITHGLLLTADERKSNAAKMLKANAEWSDRRIAEACGLSNHTVAELRPKPTRSGGSNAHLNAPKREAPDGKRYPADAEAQRKDIDEHLDKLPNASARLVATLTGAAPATVAKRKKDREGKRHLAPVPTSASAEQSAPRVGDLLTMLPGDWTDEEWSRRSDAARSAARFLNRWLRSTHFAKAADAAIDSIPPDAVADVLTAVKWQTDELNKFAERLGRKPTIKEASQ